jgi:hypothetical protein
MSSTRIRHGTLLVFTCIVTLSLSNASNAVPISIFNTGVDSSANAWGSGGVPDIHYSFFAQPSPGGLTALTVTDTAFPIPPWLTNNAGSRWIGPGTPNQPPFDGVGPGGSYTYQTTFNLPANAILSSASITGDWAIDDNGTDILINGVSTGQTYNSYSALAPFNINSGFVIGTNKLDFVVANANFGANWTGLRIDHIAGNFRVIPEPTTVALTCVGLMIGGCLCRRGRRC